MFRLKAKEILSSNDYIYRIDLIRHPIFYFPVTRVFVGSVLEKTFSGFTKGQAILPALAYFQELQEKATL